ncbi:MAG: reverse transcriptase domain-containing protein [Candidatus Paceibacterota bacterium]|jgi:retron-type reverse transcriptase
MNTKNVLHDLFKAYYDARRNKRGSMSTMSFERDYEKKLLQLGQEIVSGSYKIGRSICFICFKPLQREIFAADFRDRIIHHFVYNYINPIFENLFINDSYSCRVGKGTSYGIKRLDHFIRSCSKNYTQDCYILKLDIQGYFMSIDKNILYKKIEERVVCMKNNYSFDVAWLLALIHQIIFHDPTKDCVVKGKRENWQGLPKSKSLFGAKPDTGLPIGNLTSQLFGNVYLNEFDHFMKYKLGCVYYGRYVDDIVIVHSDREYLKSIIPIIKKYLQDELFLELHPKKIYVQDFRKGASFLGAVLKPYRTYIRNRIKGNFYKKIQDWNRLLVESDSKFIENHQVKFVASMNSYLGMLSQFDTFKLRKKLWVECVSPDFKKVIHITENYRKIISQNRDIIREIKR